MNEIRTQDITAWLDHTLEAAQFKDYCPNGLQVEGRSTIRRIVTGVTASEALLRAAIDSGADAVLVHHGWFWRGEDARVRGPRRTRLKLALEHDLNLLAYHLPLDAHPTLGNNARLAAVLGLTPDVDATGRPLTFGPNKLVWSGTVPEGTTFRALSEQVGRALARTPLCVGDDAAPVRRVAWCTGGAQSMLDDAVQADVDAYITGEASEQTTHLARETGVGFIAAGHHATERYGVQALGEALASHFGIPVHFIDIDNPV